MTEKETKKKLSKIESLKKQQAQLKARIQALEATDRQRERKRDTRRKILVGSYYLDQAQKNGTLENINQTMGTFLTRDNDRALFDLSPAKEV